MDGNRHDRGCVLGSSYVTDNATTLVIAAKPKYELIASNKLADTSRTNASPVIDNGRFRTDKYLYCVGKK